MPPRIYVGRYDPKFLGVGIRAKGSAEVHSFRLTDHKRRPQTAILTSLADDAFISDISRQTVLQHEVRHFHDSLLFPFGHATIRSRLSAIHNGFLAASTLGRMLGNANALPVPLQQWLGMTTPERAQFLDSIRHSTDREIHLPELPVIDRRDDVSDLVPGLIRPESPEETLLVGSRVALADYRLLEDLWRSPYRRDETPETAPAIAVWETAGLMCQYAAVQAVTDTAMMSRFSTWIRGYGPRTYQQGLRAIDACLDALGWQPTLRNSLALTTWSQMGAFRTELRQSAPEVRLAALVRATRRGKRWPSESSFLDLVRDWDDIVGSDSIATLINSGHDLSALATGLGGDTASHLDMSMFSGLTAARRHMLRAFLDDPDAYVDPALYLERFLRYPTPAVGISYPTRDGSVEWVDATPSEWSPEISFDVTLRLTAMAALTDAVFLPGEKSLQGSGRYEVRQLLGVDAFRIIR